MLAESKLDVEKARQNMIENLLRPWYILNQQVLNAFKAVPRDAFVPEQFKSVAYSEAHIPINEKVNMLSPLVEGRFLQELRIQPHESVLIVGTGSGFLAACAAYLGKRVTSIDIDPELNARAADIVGDLEISNLSFKTADISRDMINLDKYDAVIFTGSVPTVPDNFYRLLKDDGRMLIVTGHIDGMSCEVHYNYAGSIRKDSIFETRIERLIGFEDKPEFVF